MRSRLLAHVIFIVGFFLVVPVFSQTFAAGFLQFSPTSKTINNGDTVDVTVNITTGTDAVRGADVYVIYDPNILDYQSQTKGTFFDTVIPGTYAPNKVYIGAIMDQGSLKPTTGTGSVATLTFKAKQNGSVTLSFACGSSESPRDSRISAASGGTNTINCSQNNTMALTVGSGGSSPTATPTPTTASGSSPTATPTPTRSSSSPTATPASGGSTNPTPTTVSKLPRSGVADNLGAYGAMGALLLLLGLSARLVL